MQLVRIAGPTEPMRRLGEIAGLDFERTSARRLDEDRWQVSGYASDEALSTLRERGLEVEAVVERDDLAGQRDVLYSKLDQDRAREAQS
ncbi:MAG TPA: hypothetical protein VGV90_12025 [Solirubrobacteraceae bacterium]|nr:hypothetical protein [Solirubrobacteraceae bacterium]